jgi:uncharacterized protein (UPF0335 family)
MVKEFAKQLVEKQDRIDRAESEKANMQEDFKQ